MIWYLLYPFRGTTEAPVLAPTHPLRNAFTRYGRYVARHVLTTLLISVAVAAILIYPFPFLYTTDFSNGASNIPLHVWTDAQRLEDKPQIEPDVIMRTLWVHGSYMKALERDVLLGALELQDELLGPTKDFNPRQPTNSVELPDPLADLSPRDRNTFHVINGLTNQSWFYHSPLQYWSGDARKIMEDPNILLTVNERKTQPTSVNVTLRHSIVFSGKSFEDRQLVAADALVITLIHLRDSPIGRQWERKSEALAMKTSDKWDIYPRDGRVWQNQLYEFQFRPISVQDSIILTLAYSLTAVYFFLSLSKIRAVKSKLGLIITVMTQIALSIMSSLTVCAIFKIDLSKIPRAAYPLVILAMSLENVFRLINAVIMTPADHSTPSRIGHAFGQTGHVALANVTQNLLILWGLSSLVSPGVASFCSFAAIAILFDFFYLSTFFLSVLSVDVRRMELSDALEKASSRPSRSRTASQPRQQWTEALLQGKLALSTRIAGTIIMLGFVLVAQWHFSEHEGTVNSLARVFNFIWKSDDVAAPSPNALAGLHQARSPTSWLRLQDHETAREVINVIKPSGHSYIARVYEPLVFVLKGADRIPPVKPRWFLDAVYDFAHHQVPRFIVTVLLVVAAVRLLMNYLLWDELAESKRYDDSDEEPLLSVKTLSGGHVLDVAMLNASSDGQVISVGLDRVIRAWNVRYEFASYVVYGPKDLSENPIPVLAMAIDDNSHWLALLSTYKVFLWDLIEQKWGPSASVDLYGQKPEGFFFGSSKKDGLLSVMIVRRNGTMIELWPDERDSTEYIVCKTPLVCVAPFAEYSTSNSAPSRLSFLTLSRRGCIHRVIQNERGWLSEEVDLPTRDSKDIHFIQAVPTFSSYLIARSQTVDLVDFHSSRIIHTFQTEPMQPRTLKYLHTLRGQSQAGSAALGSLTIGYIHSETGELVLQTYLPDREDTAICFYSDSTPTTRTCCPWTETKEIKRRIDNPGSWDALPNGCIVGIRRKKVHQPSPTRARQDSPTQEGLRRRGARSSSDSRPVLADSWEVWVISQLEKTENHETMPLNTPGGRGALIIPELGPMIRVGSGSVAVGFGDVVKVVSVGHQYFETSAERLEAKNLGLISRRRNRAHGTRHRAPSSA